MLNQQPLPPAPGAVRVGDYRLLAKIGEGGMGVVHLAQAGDGSRVALKVLRPHIIGDDEARERLAREVASLRLVTSPWIAEVIDADPWGETPYVATRYVPGLSLHEHVRQEGPVRGDDLRHFAAGLAEAVIAVHRVGVLHRDIKPSNVLLEGRSPVLIDFGLARLAEDPRLTQTGWLLGTPGYLAPEILYGDDATPASDVHSWAATVVFAATGRPPFGTGPAMAIMDRVRRGEHDLSDVPPALLPLVQASLAPDPADRPGTAEVLASLRAPVRDDLTLPYVLAPQDRTGTPTTTPLTTVQPAPRTRPLTGPSVLQPARAPYMQPPAPQQGVPQQPATDDGRPRLVPPDAWRPAPGGLARLQRGSLLLGLFGIVTLGFARAPYAALAVACALALAVRTVSWTTESARQRQHLRGRRRWYDSTLTLASAPWYLVVATGGTIVLLLWSALVAFVVGFAYLMFRGPLVPGLLVMGAVLAVSLWWGPGARRVRLPTRRAVLTATRRAWTGWLAVALVVAAVALCGWSLASGGVVWDPQPGPPWRSGTMLGSLARWL
ncbi:serine/threonine protein kinase [Nocardioides panacis]|uniref:Serine/threonine protein kinase n=1 Tax=Nocardioides panacis TaxID=2849501 RepID=A0A975T175_9ACTN|nr:serine/threonine-protein kinase [Nocardioides panacis]QWZ09009.1 serine/threonine protein kinase [Nocardioides panacis]